MSKMQDKPQLRRRSVVAFLVACAFVPAAAAERFWTFDGSFSSMASYDDNPSLAGINSLSEVSNDDGSVVLGLFPSLRVESTGPRSVWQFTYSVGASFFESDSDLNFQSHQFGTVLQGDLSDRWSATFSNAFVKSQDFAGALDPIFGTFNLFGVEFETITDFEAVAVRRDSYANSADLSLTYLMSSQSNLSFGLSHDVRTFDTFQAADDQIVSSNSLEDQNRFGASFRFTRSVNSRTSWFFNQQVDHYDFKGRENSRVYRAGLGIARDLTGETNFRLSLGPSFVDSLGQAAGADGWGYDLDASITYTLRENRFGTGFRRVQGNSTGVGALSRTDNFYVNFERPFMRRHFLTLAASYYDSDPLGGNSVATRIWRGQAEWGMRLGERWSLRFGATYQDQDGRDAAALADDSLTFERRRFFVTLQYQFPGFWRFGG